VNGGPEAPISVGIVTGEDRQWSILDDVNNKLQETYSWITASIRAKALPRREKNRLMRYPEFWVNALGVAGVWVWSYMGKLLLVMWMAILCPARNTLLMGRSSIS